MNSQNLSSKDWYNALLERGKWFVIYHEIVENKLHIEYILGYEKEPSQDDIANDSYSLVQECELSFEDMKRLKIHLVDKDNLVKLVKGIEGCS